MKKHYKSLDYVIASLHYLTKGQPVRAAKALQIASSSPEFASMVQDLDNLSDNLYKQKVAAAKTVTAKTVASKVRPTLTAALQLLAAKAAKKKKAAPKKGAKKVKADADEMMPLDDLSDGDESEDLDLDVASDSAMDDTSEDLTLEELELDVEDDDVEISSEDFDETLDGEVELPLAEVDTSDDTLFSEDTKLVDAASDDEEEESEEEDEEDKEEESFVKAFARTNSKLLKKKANMAASRRVLSNLAVLEKASASVKR